MLPRHLLLMLFIAFSSLKIWGQERGAIKISTAEDTINTSYALVVGISSYANISRLLYADDDAYLFSEFLINQKICREINVKRLIDSEATAANFFREIKRLMIKAESGDRIFIYFAGHGDVEIDIESGFLLGYNCASNNYPATDAIDISMLERYVNAITKKNIKVILITDACRSGNLAGGLSGATSTISSINDRFENVVKILSCQPNQLSEEKYYRDGGHGVFTYHLVNGLYGLSDRDNDGVITLREIDIYLEEVSKETKNKQVPKIEGNPLLKLATYDKVLMQTIVSRLDNFSQSIASKNRSMEDTSWNSNEYYQTFVRLIKQSKFVEKRGQSAYTLILSAAKNNQSEAMVTDMKLELIAILEDEVQKWLNKYLRGEMETVSPVIISQLSKSKMYLEKLLKLTDQDDPRYNMILAKNYFFNVYYDFKTRNTGRNSFNIALLQKADKLLPKQAWLKHSLALLYRANNEADKAIRYEKDAISLSPTWSYPWHNLANIYLDKKNIKEAQNSFYTSIKLDSLDAYPWNNLGLIYFEQKKFANAKEAYANAVRLDPNSAIYWNNFGLLFQALNKKQEASRCFKRAVLLEPYAEFRWQRLFECVKNQQEKEEWLAKKKQLQLKK